MGGNVIYQTHQMELGQPSRYSDSIWAGRSGNKIPMEARFWALVQTGRGVHPDFHTMGTVSLFQGYSGQNVMLTTPSNTEVKERV